MKPRLKKFGSYLKNRVMIFILMSMTLFTVRAFLRFELPEKYMSLGEHSMLIVDLLFLKGKSSE